MNTFDPAAEALPGRAERMPVPDAHFVNRHASSRRFPTGSSGDVRHGLLLGRGEEVLAACPASTRRPSATPPATRRTRPTAKCAAGMTGHNEVVLVVFDPAKIRYDDLLKVFWENHDPTQGMRQGNDVGTQYRSGIYYYDDEQRQAAEASRDVFQSS